MMRRWFGSYKGFDFKLKKKTKKTAKTVQNASQQVDAGKEKPKNKGGGAFPSPVWIN